MDQEHQRNKPNKGHSEKTELNNERELRHEGTVLNNKHIRENIQHYTTREQKAFTLNHHHTTTPNNSRLYL